MKASAFTLLRDSALKFLLVPMIAALAISSASASGTYNHIEASFQLPGLATDPFNFEVTAVEVTILQPDSSTVMLPAFFDGGTTWRVRHTPTNAGTYTITSIKLNDSPASYVNLQPTNWVVTGFPTSVGYVQLDPTNPRRFMTSNGRRFYPVGEDVAWSSPTANALNIFPKMGAAHETWSRVWMTHFYDSSGLGLNLDWPAVSNNFGALSLTVASNWDAIVTAADAAGIHFQMTLQHHGQYSTQVDPNWPDNPWNTANGGFLANPTNFFTDATAIDYTKRKYHYIIARWGYSPAIMAWELFNEVQFTDAAGDGNLAIGQWNIIQAWHDEMAQFIRTNDPYHHLITTSSVLNEPIWDDTSYYTHHDYPSDIINGMRNTVDITAGQTVAPDYASECGISTTPHLGISPPIWAGMMSGQSAAAMPWYWDTIDPNNDYFLIQAAADFVTVSGLGDQDVLNQSAPLTSGGPLQPLSFVPGGGFETNQGPDTFTVGNSVPDGINLSTPYLQGNGNHNLLTNGYTFFVNYGQAGTFSTTIGDVSSCGGTLQIIVDGVTKTNVVFPGNSTCGSSYTPYTTNTTYTVAITSGSHTIHLKNSGADWLLLTDITLNPYVPLLSAFAIGGTNFTAIWLWHSTNVLNATPGPAVTGTVAVAGLNAGTYSAVWWDTFGAGAISNFTFTVANSNTPVTLTTPPVLRSVAFYAGLPVHAGITPPNLTPNVLVGSPAFDLPFVITNSGGLPLSYALSFGNGFPSWLAVSSTNGYVSKTSAQSITLALNPATLAAGRYTNTIIIGTSDPALSATNLPLVLTVVPTAPQLTVLSAAKGNFTFQITGDTNTAYTIQSSFDLVNWTFLSTNTLPSGTLNVTNAISTLSPTAKYFRAIWHP